MSSFVPLSIARHLEGSGWPRKKVVKRLKRTLLNLVKFGIPAAIIGWLLSTVPPEQFQELQERPKNWPLLLTALLIVFAAVSLTFLRWYFLVRALQLPFRLIDAFRLGFLGFLFNFVSAGSVGGDLFKAFFIAREQPGRRAEAVATVVVDRLIGLYALLLLTSGVILITGVPDSTPQLRTLSRATLVTTIIGGCGLLMLLVPGFTSGAVSEMMTGLPKIGNMLGKLIAAVRIYRRKWSTVVVAIIMSVGTHALFALAFFLIAAAMFRHVPTLREHMIMVPLGMVAGAVPFLPGGLGAFELAIKGLYQIVPAATNIDVSGILVALVYRLMTILVAAIGMVIYWSSRREVRQVLEVVEHEREAVPGGEATNLM